MGKLFTEISASHREFISRQKIFFTGTAAETGRVNISPKGLNALRVLSPHRVAYVDLTGSGNETAAHLAANGRLTLMFCSFEGEPLILRLYGRATSVYPRHEAWAQLRPLFGASQPGERQIVDLHVESVQTSCGFGVPLYQFESERDLLPKWAEKKGSDGIAAYWAEKNTRSIDGFPTHLLDA